MTILCKTEQMFFLTFLTFWSLSLMYRIVLVQTVYSVLQFSAQYLKLNTTLTDLMLYAFCLLLLDFNTKNLLAWNMILQIRTFYPIILLSTKQEQRSGGLLAPQGLLNHSKNKSCSPPEDLLGLWLAWYLLHNVTSVPSPPPPDSAKYHRRAPLFTLQHKLH